MVPTLMKSISLLVVVSVAAASAGVRSSVRSRLTEKASASSMTQVVQDIVANTTVSGSLEASVGIVTWNVGKKKFEDNYWMDRSGVLGEDLVFVTLQETEQQGLTLSALGGQYTEKKELTHGTGNDRTTSRLFVKTDFEQKHHIEIQSTNKLIQCPAAWGKTWDDGKVVQWIFVTITSKEDTTKVLMLSFLGAHMTPHQKDFGNRYNKCFQPAWKFTHLYGDAVFMAGDLNFRQESFTHVTVYDSTKDQLQSMAFPLLQANDGIQLKEATISFPASYKRIKESDQGCYKSPYDKMTYNCYDDWWNPKHYPSWTDRVLWKTNGEGQVTSKFYKLIDDTDISDHIPVAWSGTVRS